MTNLNKYLPHFYQGRFSVAPMLDWTTKHCRYFHRQFSRYAQLYTEMVTTGAILYAKYDHLDFSCEEYPLVLQLGGSDPQLLQQCAKEAQSRGYQAINLNVGCPSDRVQNGRFGACLMAEPELVARCVGAMQEVVELPVSVKTRIGIDQLDSEAFLYRFVEMVSQAGCSEFIIHARKAWLSGLSPKENRDIPPLDYDRVYRLKQHFPQLKITINGGIKTIEEIRHHLNYVDGVMIGREVYQNPALLGHIDRLFFDPTCNVVSPGTAVKKMFPYIEKQLQQGVRLNHITRHMLGAFQQCRGAKQWRRYLSENACKPNADLSVLENALKLVEH